jgi:hypothetical protein
MRIIGLVEYTVGCWWNGSEEPSEIKGIGIPPFSQKREKDWALMLCGGARL